MPLTASFLSELNRVVALPEVLVVGGAVRDRLLGKPTIDIDIVVPSHPEQIALRIEKKLGGKSFPLDKERGILRISFPDGHYVDIAKRQGNSVEMDLDRRDFTINALAVPLTRWVTPQWKKALIDRKGGLGHLKKGLLVPVSKHVFRDDPLRLLRAYRIAAELGFSLSQDTQKLIQKNAPRIKKSAPERVREEWLKMFSTPRAYRALTAMDQSGLLDVLFPESKILRRTAPGYYGKGGVLKHTLDSVSFFEDILTQLKSWFPSSHKKIQTYLEQKISGYSRAAHCKWALLLHDIGKPKTARIIDKRMRFFEHEHVGADMVQKMSSRYRWSTDETQRFAKLVRNHMRPGSLAVQSNVTDKAIFRFFRDLGDDAIDMLLVSLADHLTYLSPAERKKRNSAHEKITIEMIRRFYRQHDRVVPPKLLNGFDVMKALNLPPSPLIGTLMKEVQEAQSEGKVKTKQDAIAYLKKHAPQS